jgi:hypothetical protein
MKTEKDKNHGKALDVNDNSAVENKKEGGKRKKGKDSGGGKALRVNENTA